jgi:hypothetical protein
MIGSYYLSEELFMKNRKNGRNLFKNILFLGSAFCIYISFLFFSVKEVNAATVTWTGTATGTWETAGSWSGGAVPTSGDDVTINSTTGTALTVTLSSGQTASFNTLTLGGGAASSSLILAGNFGTSGSMTVDSNGYFEQKNSSTQALTGTLTIKNRGWLTHTTNTSAFLYSLDMTAQTIDLQSGGQINVLGRGYKASFANNGPGPGGGKGGGSALDSGGGHGGDGGSGGTSNDGGMGYCNITNVSTIGSAGTGNLETGGNGGGLVRLTAAGTFTISGSIVALGQGTGGTNTSGGGGGGVKITADTITGTPTLFSIAGGASGSGTNASGGGGGCVQLSYTTSNSIAASQVIMNGGSGTYQRGGGGLLYIKQTTATYGDLYSFNSINSATAASSTLGVGNLTLNSLSLASTKLVVTSTNSLTLSNASATPFANSSSTYPGTLYVKGAVNLGTGTLDKIGLTVDAGTFTNSSTLSLTTSASLSLLNTTTLATPLTSVSSSGAFTLTRGGFTPAPATTTLSLTINASTTILTGYSSTTPRLELGSLTINSGGVLTTSANTSANSNSINISATNITIAAGGVMSADGKGYSGASEFTNWDGTGPGKGTGVDGNSGRGGGGGGHGGAGGTGSGSGGGTGGVAYCDTSNIFTFGSSGGGSGITGAQGGSGGGLIVLNATSTLTINGNIVARGITSTVGSPAGGGGGGGIKLTANIITGTPNLFSVAGGYGKGDTSGVGQTGGGGGGGCVQMIYKTSNSIATSTVNRSGGSTDSFGSPAASSGSQGASVTSVQSNTFPTTTAFTPVQISSTTVRFTTMISDTDQQITNFKINYSTDGGSTWATTTLGTVTSTSGVPTTTSGRIGNLPTDVGSVTVTTTWNILTDIPNIENSNVKIRIIPNDGATDGTTNTSSAFSVDTKPPTLCQLRKKHHD